MMAYCNEEDFEDADNLSQPCILCGSTGLTSCIIEDCGHSCALICTKCVSLVKNCPDCHRRNKAYGRKQKSEGDIGIFSDLTYNKNISQPSTNPAALSNRADDQHTARQKAYKRGYPKREIQTTDPFYFSQPSTSQQFEYGQQHNNPIYPYLYSYPYAYPYGHPNDDPSIENDDPATSTNHGAYQGNQ